PEKPTQATSSAEMSAKRSTLRTATLHARHQSSGCCSAQPILGEANGACSSVADANTAPCRLISRARVPPVPTSMPKTYMLRCPCLDSNRSPADRHNLTPEDDVRL